MANVLGAMATQRVQPMQRARSTVNTPVLFCSTGQLCEHSAHACVQCSEYVISAAADVLCSQKFISFIARAPNSAPTKIIIHEFLRNILWPPFWIKTPLCLFVFLQFKNIF
jgi:hypothetical protein